MADNKYIKSGKLIEKLGNNIYTAEVLGTASPGIFRVKMAPGFIPPRKFQSNLYVCGTHVQGEIEDLNNSFIDLPYCYCNYCKEQVVRIILKAGKVPDKYMEYKP